MHQGKQRIDATVSRASLSEAERLAEEYYDAGRLVDAKLQCERILEAQPAHAGALHRLGVIAFQVGRADLAATFLERAIDAGASGPMYFHLGLVLQAVGSIDAAIRTYRRALEVDPALPEAHLNLGGLYKLRGMLDESIEHYRAALSLRNDYAEAHGNLGNALFAQGKVVEAMNSYRAAIAIQPHFADAHLNLGNALFVQTEIDAALDHFRKALSINKSDVEAHNGIASVFLAKGQISRALEICETSLAIRETVEAKTLVVRCIDALSVSESHANLPNLVVRAMEEPWARPSHLVGACVAIVKRRSEINACIRHAETAWSATDASLQVFGRAELTSLANDQVLTCMLENAPVCDGPLERVLAILRATMLRDTATNDAADGEIARLYCSLARQCFLNEYVYRCTQYELDAAAALRSRLIDALERYQRIPPLWIVVVGAYFPLYSVPHAERMLEHSWDEPIAGVLRQQIREPLTETQLRATIRSLTATEDEISLAVQDQYERNPYPRWTKSRPAGSPRTIDAILAQDYPSARAHRLEKHESLDVLIAGCGTGQQSIEAAQRIMGANVLAVDLSYASLCHAKRKTEELGLRNIEYAQADILNLGSIERRFDLIECIGVLHHLHDPMAGLRVLVSLLRPGGYINLGLYSELGRQDVVAAHRFIASAGYAANAEDIRRCRQALLEKGVPSPLSRVAESSDFFVTSGCRDLLFHVQEHRFTLPIVGDMLRSAGLSFMGFAADPRIIASYAGQYPEDETRTDLDKWHALELKLPDTFRGMYQFWAAKDLDCREP